MIYKHFEKWGHGAMSPPCNTYVIPVSLYKFMSSFVTKTHARTHTHTHTHAHTHTYLWTFALIVPLYSWEARMVYKYGNHSVPSPHNSNSFVRGFKCNFRSCTLNCIKNGLLYFFYWKWFCQPRTWMSENNITVSQFQRIPFNRAISARLNKSWELQKTLQMSHSPFPFFWFILFSLINYHRLNVTAGELYHGPAPFSVSLRKAILKQWDLLMLLGSRCKTCSPVVWIQCTKTAFIKYLNP